MMVLVSLLRHNDCVGVFAMEKGQLISTPDFP